MTAIERLRSACDYQLVAHMDAPDGGWDVDPTICALLAVADAARVVDEGWWPDIREGLSGEVHRGDFWDRCQRLRAALDALEALP